MCAEGSTVLHSSRSGSERSTADPKDLLIVDPDPNDLHRVDPKYLQQYYISVQYTVVLYISTVYSSTAVDSER